MALIGLVLATVYPIVVRESRIGETPARQRTGAAPGTRRSGPSPLVSLFSTRSVVCAYVGSGLQLYICGALLAWMPSFLYRDYEMDTDRAGGVAALLVLCGGTGMILCGTLSDRLGASRADRKIAVAIGCCALSCMLLLMGFNLPPGVPQLALVAGGMRFSRPTASTTGISTGSRHSMVNGSR